MTNRKPSKKLQATAYHEAGHAVAAIHHYVKLHKVTIVPTADGSASGHIITGTLHHFDPEPNTSAKARDEAERLMIMLLAGGVAESRFRGRHNWVGAKRDMHTVTNMSLDFYLHPEVNYAYRQFVLERARAFVAEPTFWKEITDLAEALLKSKTLTGKEATSVILAVNAPKPTRRPPRAHDKNTHPATSAHSGAIWGTVF
jgi:hypothetical protein